MSDLILTVEQRRAELGLTVDAMCYKAGIPVSTYNSYLYEGREPVWSRAKKLLKGVGLEVVLKEVAT